MPLLCRASRCPDTCRGDRSTDYAPRGDASRPRRSPRQTLRPARAAPVRPRARGPPGQRLLLIATVETAKQPGLRLPGPILPDNKLIAIALGDAQPGIVPVASGTKQNWPKTLPEQFQTLCAALTASPGHARRLEDGRCVAG